MRPTIGMVLSISKTQFEDHKSILRFMPDSPALSFFTTSLILVESARRGPYLLAAYVVNSIRGAKWAGLDGEDGCSCSPGWLEMLVAWQCSDVAR